MEEWHWYAIMIAVVLIFAGGTVFILSSVERRNAMIEHWRRIRLPVAAVLLVGGVLTMVYARLETRSGQSPTVQSKIWNGQYHSVAMKHVFIAGAGLTLVGVGSGGAWIASQKGN